MVEKGGVDVASDEDEEEHGVGGGVERDIFLWTVWVEGFRLPNHTQSKFKPSRAFFPQQFTTKFEILHAKCCLYL